MAPKAKRGSDGGRQKSTLGKATKVEEKEDKDSEDEEEQEEEEEPEVLLQWLLLAGGLNGPKTLASTEVLRLGTDECFPGPSLLRHRWGCTAIQLEGPRVLVAGGFDGEGYLRSTEIVDLREWTVTEGPTMSIARAGCSAVRVTRHEIVVLGGYSLDSSEILNTQAMSFKPGPQLRTARACAAAIMLDENRLMVAGGYDRLGCCDTTEILDLRKAPREDEWDETSPPSLEKARFWPGPRLSRPRGGCAVARAGMPGRVLFVGGFDGVDRLSSTELLDLGNYNIPCAQLTPALGDRVIGKEGNLITVDLYQQKKKEGEGEGEESEEESEEEEDEEGVAPRKKNWTLDVDADATVVAMFDPELQDDSDQDDDAEEGLFRLADTEGFETCWTPLADFSHPPKHEMTWSAGPPLCSCRSGSIAVLFPTVKWKEQLPLKEGGGEEVHKPRVIVAGGCDESPNRALKSGEVLEGEETLEFVERVQLCERRAYCAAGIATVLGKLWPQIEEERKEKEEEERKQREEEERKQKEEEERRLQEKIEKQMKEAEGDSAQPEEAAGG